MGIGIESSKEICEAHGWNYIGTSSGLPLHIFPINKNDIRIYDIISGLSKIPRFNGQTKFEDKIISVAEHSVNVAKVVEARGGTDMDIYAALLHDAAEAYMCDMPSPFKAKMPEYCKIIKGVQTDIYEALGVTDFNEKLVKQADYDVLVTEAKEAMSGWEIFGIDNDPGAEIDIKYWDYLTAQRAFRAWYVILNSRIKRDK